MLTSISEFPIVLEQRPGYSRRQQHGSTFVRAHVMSKYHHERRASPSSARSPLHRASSKIPPQQQNRLVGGGTSLKFVEYTGPKAARNEEGHQMRLIVTPARRKSKKTSVEVGKEIGYEAPLGRGLQLRDPRELWSARLGLAFQAYSKHLKNRQLPLDTLSKTWLPVAFTDPVLFHAIMFNFSQHLYALCSIDHEKPYLIQHKVHALRHISSRIQNPKLASSDAVVASILCLVSHDLLKKDWDALTTHIYGLRKLIILRGGVDALGLKNTLKMVYLSYELILSTCFRASCKKLWSSSIMLEDPMSPARCNILTFATGSIQLHANELDIMSIKVIQDLEHTLTNCNTSTSSNLLTGTEYCIISPWRTQISSPSLATPPYTSFSEHALPAIFLALNLDPSLPELSTNLSIFPTSNLQVAQLKNHLNLSPLDSLWYPIPGALLWCLLVGVQVSQDAPEHPWFVANLMRTVTALAFVDWEGVKSCMQQLVSRGTDRK